MRLTLPELSCPKFRSGQFAWFQVAFILRHLHDITEVGEVDGDFGPPTHGAVVTFQFQKRVFWNELDPAKSAWLYAHSASAGQSDCAACAGAALAAPRECFPWPCRTA